VKEALQVDMRESIERIVVNDDTIDNGNHHDVLDPVWWLTNIYEGEEAYNQSLADFSREQRLILAIEWYFAEVNNGGHGQFYFNSTGIVWKDAMDGCRKSVSTSC
jgi:hypothetical protein